MTEHPQASPVGWAVGDRQPSGVSANPDQHRQPRTVTITLPLCWCSRTGQPTPHHHARPQCFAKRIRPRCATTPDDVEAVDLDALP